MKYVYFGNELYHHGVMGMKCGVRRFQNYDGTRIGSPQIATKQKQDQNYKDISSDFSTVLKNFKGQYDTPEKAVDSKDAFIKKLATTKSMTNFFNSKNVEQVYKKRNKAYDTADDDLDIYRAGDTYRKEIINEIKNYLGDNVKKPCKMRRFENIYETNYGNAMLRVIDAIDTTGNDTSWFKYSNENSWLPLH